MSGKAKTNGSAEKAITAETVAKSLVVSQRGIRTSGDFEDMMIALMSDLSEGRVTPNVSNAICNAGGKLLKVIEMQYRYGTAKPGAERPVLRLSTAK